MQKTDSLEKTLMLGKFEGGRRRGWQKMRRLDGTDSMNMSLSKLWEWRTGRPGVLQSMGSQRVRHDWVTELNWTFPLKCEEVKKCVKKVFLLPIHSGVFTQALLSWSALPALQSWAHRGNSPPRAWELPAGFPSCALSLDLTASSSFLRAQLKGGFPELSDLPATEAGPATRYGHSRSSGWFYILYSPWHHRKVSELFIWWSAFCQPQLQPTLQANRHFVGLTHFHKTPGRVCGVWKRWSNIFWMNELPHVSAQIPENLLYFTACNS